MLIKTWFILESLAGRYINLKSHLSIEGDTIFWVWQEEEVMDFVTTDFKQVGCGFLCLSRCGIEIIRSKAYLF